MQFQNITIIKKKTDIYECVYVYVCVCLHGEINCNCLDSPGARVNNESEASFLPSLTILALSLGKSSLIRGQRLSTLSSCCEYLPHVNK